MIQLDEKRRGVFPEPFKPGDRLVVDDVGSETITLHLLKSVDVPTVGPRWVKGRMFGAEVELNPAEVAAAVCADRSQR